MLETRRQALRSFRQGDELLVPCAQIPATPQKKARAQGRVSLAEGERTGHACTMIADRVGYFREDGSGSGAYMNVARLLPVALPHEERGTLSNPPANYRLVGQRECQPRAAPFSLAD